MNWNNLFMKPILVLLKKLVDSLQKEPFKSICNDFFYTGRAKTIFMGNRREKVEALVNWANKNGGKVTGLLFQNVFGALATLFITLLL